MYMYILCYTGCFEMFYQNYYLLQIELPIVNSQRGMQNGFFLPISENICIPKLRSKSVTNETVF